MPSLPASMSHYSPQSVLGEGDLSFVYHATNTRNGQEVALKVLREDTPVLDPERHFELEATILKQLKHTNIPCLYEHIPGSKPGLAIQMIDGKDGEMLIAELPEAGFLAVRSVVHWGIQLADALAYLHAHQPPFAFRDLKPAHMMVDSLNQAWLIDFNLSQELPADSLTFHGEALGTEGFAPPELYAGIASPLVDIYALGATLHYLLTRINPRHERRFCYAPPRSVNPEIPRSLAQVIMKMLAYEPEDRFQRMTDVLDELTAVRSEINR